MYNDDYDFMKLTNISDKYLTNIDNKAMMKNKVYSTNQKVAYNIQGELIVDNKCLTSDISGNNVYFDECRKDKNQSWQIYDDKIILSEDKNKCLSSDNDKLKVKKCSNNDEMQTWNVEQPDVNKSTDYILPKYKGKLVVLVDSDNPWYLNNDTTIPEVYNDEFNEYVHGCGKNLDTPETANANQGTEYFTTDDDSNENKTSSRVILLLLIIVIMLIVYKVFKDRCN